MKPRYTLEIDGIEYPIPSVTEVLDMIGEPGLEMWIARKAAEAAVDSVYLGDGADASIRAGQFAPMKIRNKAASSGTLVHTLVDLVLTGQPVDLYEGPDEQALERASARAIISWVHSMERSGARVVASEARIIQPIMRYGGTMDLVLEIDGHGYVVDYKTGNSVRRKTILQLAAYRHLWNSTGRTPKISGGCIVHSPLGGPLKTHSVPQSQLDHASPLFGALLGCYNALQTLTLEKGVTNEDV